MPMNMKKLKRPFGELSVNEHVAELCLQHHQKLGQTQDEIQNMANAITELAAKFGNEEVFQWAIQNNFYDLELFQDDLFKDVTKYGQQKSQISLTGTAEKCWRMLWPEPIWSSWTLF
jgi:hypothetical protein